MLERHQNCKIEVKSDSQLQQQEPNSTQRGHWMPQENLKYLIFLEFHLSKFSCRKKRFWKLYKALSSFIPTRTPQQCRCHHRKMLHRFSNSQRILLNLKKTFSNQIYQKQYQNHVRNQLKDINVERTCLVKSENKIKSVREQRLQGQRQVIHINSNINPDRSQQIISPYLINYQPMSNAENLIYPFNYQLSCFYQNYINNMSYWYW